MEFLKKEVNPATTMQSIIYITAKMGMLWEILGE
jgi:hypothetical protein